MQTSPADGKRRKRAKTTTTTPTYDVKSVSTTSVQNETNDDLMNFAFNSTAIEEDEIIAATQLNQSKTNLHKSKTSSFDHPNKENAIVKRTPAIVGVDVEKSPTVLGKRPTRTETKRSNDRAVTPERILSPKKDINKILRTPSSSCSPKVKARKSATKTPRRLFDNWMTSPTSKRSPASPQRSKATTSVRSKLRLVTPTSRMKQSTLKFAKVSSSSNLDETSNHQTEINVTFSMHSTSIALTTLSIDVGE